MLKADKKRYVRHGDNGKLEWIGWQDRHLFPPGSPDPAYLFIRPFNVFGDFFGETRLLDWIVTNHLDLKKGAQCTKDQLGYRDECLRELSLTLSEANELILVPVGSKYWSVVANLRCSLEKLGIFNIIHWALDLETHDRLVEEGHLSYFVQGFLR